MIQAKLAIGPMSSEIIEAVFRYSHYMRAPLMLIVSKNQIDHAGGYVNKWTTKQYGECIREMKSLYPQSNVVICRDHCGPGFNGNMDIQDVYKTIQSDIENGFDLIHIDFCHMQGDREHVLNESKKAVEYCLQLNPNILLEIGTDENMGTNYGAMNIREIENELDFFSSFCKPEFFVVQTGSLVMEIGQVGSFNAPFVKQIGHTIRSRGLKLKEHNADYLTKDQIASRFGLVDAMNIAPQLGVIQTQTILTKCSIYGVNTNEFIEEVYNGGKWKKWLHTNTAENKHLCATIAGHYHFHSKAYKDIIQQLSKHEDIRETIINNIFATIEHYDKSLQGGNNG